jgi:DNA-directed RNA polymerase subunit RPC12/RpoP
MAAVGWCVRCLSVHDGKTDCSNGEKRRVSVKILIAGCLPKDRAQIEGVVKKAFGGIPEDDPWNVSLVKMGSSWSISLEGPDPKFQGLSLTAPEDHLQETIVEALGTNGKAAPTASPAPTASAPPVPSASPTPAAPPRPRASSPPPASRPLTWSVPPAALPRPTGSSAPTTSPPSLEELEAAEGLLVEAAAAPGGTNRDTDRGDRYDCSACGRPFKVIYTAEPREGKVKAPVACPNCWAITEVSVPESSAATEEYRAEAIAN